MGPVTAVLSALLQHEITFLRFLRVVSHGAIAMTYVWHMLDTKGRMFGFNPPWKKSARTLLFRALFSI